MSSMPLIKLPVTAIFAAVHALLIIILGFRVVKLRRKLRVGYGEGRDEQLKRALSAHGNAVENIPIAILLMLLLEIAGVNVSILVSIAILFFIARLIHAQGLNSSLGKSFGRTYGTILSWFMISFMAFLNIYFALSLNL